MRASAAAVLESLEGEAVVLEDVRVEATINDLLADVTVTQRYRNPEKRNVEAVYTFPLPLDGVLLDFTVEIGDRRLAGTVVEKAKAERRYEDAITDGDAAILLEQAEPGLYTASVGNILPGETVTVRFRYGLLLRWNGDRVRFQMSTTIAPRYGDPESQGGLSPHQAPTYAFDAKRAFGLRVTVRGLLKDARFNSSSHDVSIEERAGETIIALTGAPAMDRDFVLEAKARRPESGGALLARDGDGWVALASFRPEITEADGHVRRSIKIVVDCSGSMGGDSIAQARAALERILDGLHPGDLFEIIAFGSTWQGLFGCEKPVTEWTLAKARQFVRRLDADMGGTEIADALNAAYAVRGKSNLPRDLLLITDGEVWERDKVIARAKASGHRIFTVGVGSAVNEGLVRDLAAATGGACELVAPRDDMAVRIHRHFQRLYAPHAVKADVHWPKPARNSVPDPIGPVYGGDTIHVFAWFAEKPEGPVRLEVTLADGHRVRHDAAIVPADDGPVPMPASEGASLPTLARLAAARRLATLEDRTAATELALRYQLVSAWTDYIVVHVRAEDEKADDLPDIIKVPQVVAAGWHGTGTVFAERMEVRALRCYDMVLDQRPREVARSREPDCGFLLKPEPDSRTLGPAALVALLNSRSVPPVPTLDELDSWGLPDAVIAPLEELVASGADEDAVVLAFLHLLANSEAGRGLKRQTRREILKAFKQTGPDPALIEAVREALKDWPAWNAMEGQEG